MSKVIRKLITTPKAPKPVAPYNQAVAVDNTLYVSGVLGLNKDTMTLVPGGLTAEARQALESLGHILQAAGSSFEKVVKINIMLKNISEFASVNDIYSEFFTKDFPARCTYQVAALPLNAEIEIDAIAIIGNVETINTTVGCSTCGTSACSCK